jgi:hypothetical protein
MQAPGRGFGERLFPPTRARHAPRGSGEEDRSSFERPRGALSGSPGVTEGNPRRSSLTRRSPNGATERVADPEVSMGASAAGGHRGRGVPRIPRRWAVGRGRDGLATRGHNARDTAARRAAGRYSPPDAAPRQTPRHPLRPAGADEPGIAAFLGGSLPISQAPPIGAAIGKCVPVRRSAPAETDDWIPARPHGRLPARPGDAGPGRGGGLARGLRRCAGRRLSAARAPGRFGDDANGKRQEAKSEAREATPPEADVQARIRTGQAVGG